MRTDTVFSIGDNDFSDKVLGGTYSVGDEDIYTVWQDANGRNHHEVYRKQLKGSFDMLFKTVEDFNVFNEAYKEARFDSGLIRVSIMNNSTNAVESKDVYLSFKPIRNRRDDWNDYYEQFTVDVEEW